MSRILRCCPCPCLWHCWHHARELIRCCEVLAHPVLLPELHSSNCKVFKASSLKQIDPFSTILNLLRLPNSAFFTSHRNNETFHKLSFLKCIFQSFKKLHSPMLENMVPKAEIKVVKIEISILKTKRFSSSGFQN